ncbi:hypothetical protein CMI37_02530 [Candidatus Pacearchaeota archaeon]|jgi:DNA-binding MarR family transcriptional regulator|nr:hypothetical protein [Candidatus Pacearchaeota archaeon]|tara:strand:- start:971 stop:1360 length:390 start_codon:yes stop_codon:yes gene_type:complete
MDKSVPIKTTKGKFFRQYLELLNPLLRLRGKELDVLAEILYYNHKLEKIPEKHRWKLIFDYDTKTEICQKLQLSDASLNNNLSALRKKGIIKKNKVTNGFLIYPNNYCKLTFSFNITTENGISTDEENL